MNVKSLTDKQLKEELQIQKTILRGLTNYQPLSEIQSLRKRAAELSAKADELEERMCALPQAIGEAKFKLERLAKEHSIRSNGLARAYARKLKAVADLEKQMREANIEL